jgi:hypothetical protein
MKIAPHRTNCRGVAKQTFNQEYADRDKEILPTVTAAQIAMPARA